MSSTRKKIKKDDIEVGRQKVLEAIYSELPDDRFAKREAVKQLMPTLVSARDRGLSFERIAQLLQLDIPPSTLRSYYFQLKSDAATAAQTVQHRKKVARTREAISRRILEKHTEHANELASRRADQTQATPSLVNAFQDVEVNTRRTAAAREQAESRRLTEDLTATARPASPAAPPAPPAAPRAVQLHSERTELPALVSEKGTTIDLLSPDGIATISSANDAAGVAMTLTAIEVASMATDERTELLESVELREGELVFYVSGKPFHGFLRQNQIYLLRKVGKLIASENGRTSKDFVKMPTKL